MNQSSQVVLCERKGNILQYNETRVSWGEYRQPNVITRFQREGDSVIHLIKSWWQYNWSSQFQIQIFMFDINLNQLLCDTYTAGGIIFCFSHTTRIKLCMESIWKADFQPGFCLCMNIPLKHLLSSNISSRSIGSIIKGWFHLDPSILREGIVVRNFCKGMYWWLSLSILKIRKFRQIHLFWIKYASDCSSN